MSGYVHLNLKKQHPIQLIDRCMFLQTIREIGPDKIQKLDKKFHVFLSEFEDGTFEIDWEFCIFGATLHQWEMLLDNFIAVPKPNEEAEEPKSNLILPDEKPLDQRPKLII